MGSVKTLKENKMVTGMEVDTSILTSAQCKVCIQAKQHMTPFLKELKRKSKQIGEMTYSDLWELAHMTAIGGY